MRSFGPSRIRAPSIGLTLAIGLALALALVGPSALAQISSDSSKPIDVTADQTEEIASKCLSTWKGSAEALQGDSRLRADVLNVYFKIKGANANGQVTCTGETKRLEADGDVYYVTPTQVAHGAHAVYDPDADQIVFTGDVIVVQGKNVVRGDRLVIHVSTRAAQMQSDARGRGTPGRVRGVFYPNQQGAPGASGPGLPPPR